MLGRSQCPLSCHVTRTGSLISPQASTGEPRSSLTCVCMCTYRQTGKHIGTHVCTQCRRANILTCVHMSTHMQTGKHTHMCTYVCTHADGQAYTRVHICRWASIHTCVHMGTHMQMGKHTGIYVCTHMHTYPDPVALLWELWENVSVQCRVTTEVPGGPPL